MRRIAKHHSCTEEKETSTAICGLKHNEITSNYSRQPKLEIDRQINVNSSSVIVMLLIILVSNSF